MAATPYPGSTVDVPFTVDGESKLVSIRIASGHITRAAVIVE